MGIRSAFFISLLIGVAIGEEYTCDAPQDSLVPVTILATAEQYQACKEYGECTFNPQCVTWNDYDEGNEPFEGKTYFEVCRKIHFKLEQLEAEYPEIRSLKLKLIRLIDSYYSTLDFESSKGESVVMKILDFLRNLIEKLKAEYEEEMYKPAPMHTPEPMVYEEEVTAEPEHESDGSLLVGSIRGIPGIHFPNYTEIPITSFSCSDKTIIPGFYADLETGCQVFHLCYEHRRESFLCPIGTIFNQPILACDYWYSGNCSQSPIYYEEPNIPEPEKVDTEIPEFPKKDVVTDFMKFLPVKAKVTDLPKHETPIYVPEKSSVTLEDKEAVADKIFDGILSLGSHISTKTSGILKSIPDPQDKPASIHFPLKTKLAAKALATTVPLAKAKKITSAMKLTAAVKMASTAAIASGKIKMAYAAVLPMKAKVAALPILKLKAAAAADVAILKGKTAKAAAVLPLKAKVAALPILKLKAAAADVGIVKAKTKVAALPILKLKAAAADVGILKAKTKVAALPILKLKAAAADVGIVKGKVASKKLPIVKGKLLALPLAKTKLGAAAFPAYKAKKAAVTVPYLKMAALKPKIALAPLKSAVAVPLIKAKLATAGISPLTKKALALGYLKLLKAKKFALIG